MKKINITKFLFLFLSFVLFSCGNDDDNYRTFTGPQEALLFNAPTSVLEVTPEVSSFIEVLVSSTTISNVDRLIPISISPTSVAIPEQYSVDLSTAVIPAGENTAFVKIFSGEYDSLPLTGGVSLVLVFDEAGYVLPNRTNHVVSIERGCLDTKVNFNLNFDAYASEISWFLMNSLGDVIASSGPYNDGLVNYKQNFCLTPGDYTFVMDDSYGDGLAPGGFTIALEGGDTLVTFNGGPFGSGPGGSAGPVSFNFTID